MTANDLYHDLILQGFSLSVNGANESDSFPPSSHRRPTRPDTKNKAELMALVASNDYDDPTAKAQTFTATELIMRRRILI